MVLKDAEMDEIWKNLGSYRGELRKHLEAAIQTEERMFSMVPERLFREYQDLKSDYQYEHLALEKLQRDYTLRVKGLDERTKELIAANKRIAALESINADLQRKYYQK
jgi:alkylhydroperoxidase/carboxymuconolactone decarboxylase family protein YurZ